MNRLTKINTINDIFNTVSNFADRDWPVKSFMNKSTVYEKENSYFIELSVPGYSKKDIDIEITENSLIVTGTLESASNLVDSTLDKTYSLTVDSDVDNIKATVINGILKIEVPLIKPKVYSKKVKVS